MKTEVLWDSWFVGQDNNKLQITGLLIVTLIGEKCTTARASKRNMICYLTISFKPPTTQKFKMDVYADDREGDPENETRSQTKARLQIYKDVNVHLK